MLRAFNLKTHELGASRLVMLIQPVSVYKTRGIILRSVKDALQECFILGHGSSVSCEGIVWSEALLADDRAKLFPVSLAAEWSESVNTPQRHRHQ